jgi:TRAP-type C4-dicarboxylate transport system substrate-binding protein
MHHRRFLSLLLAVPLLLLANADAVAETWRLAHQMPPDSPEGRVWQAFADRAAEYTGGEVEIRIFPSSQLGKPQAVIEQLQAGTVQVFAEGIGFLEAQVPELRWVAAPFLFDDRAHWRRFMASELVAGWLAEVKTKAGIALIGDPSAIQRGPYRVIVSKTPILKIEDLQGVKLRMYSTRIAVESWNHLGAEVIVMGWSDVYEGLRRGVVSAVTGPISLIESMRFYEVAQHIGRTDEFPQGLALMANARAWDGLSENARKGLLRAQTEAAELAERINQEIASTTIESMKGKGASFAKVDTSGFVTRMQEYYRSLDAKGELPAGLLTTVAATRG